MKVLFKIGSEKKGFSLSIITETDSKLRGFNFPQWIQAFSYSLYFLYCSAFILQIVFYM